MRDSITMTTFISNEHFEEMFGILCHAWLDQKPFDRGEVHAQKTTTPEMVTREMTDVTLDIWVGRTLDQWQDMVRPNLPWAEDHFLERISGEPLNPPPSEAYWPYAQQGNSAHKQYEKFSHTYPERFWPKFAENTDWVDLNADDGHLKTINAAPPRHGIRYEYGDLRDLLAVLKKNPRSRQAYLPIWFPEDIEAARQGERVPCTLGYHFLQHADGLLHMTYPMRSCDLLRFFRDDVYMAGRLLQYVASEIGLVPGKVRMNIANLHAFEGDLATITQLANRGSTDRRANYNFDALG